MKDFGERCRLQFCAIKNFSDIFLCFLAKRFAQTNKIAYLCIRNKLTGVGGDHKVKGKSVVIPLQIRCKSDPYIEDISPMIGSYAK